MIKELTDKQRGALSKYRDKWLKIGLSTDECDTKEAEKWIRKAYINAGLKEPKHILWLDSPIGCVYAYFVFENVFKIFGMVNNEVISKIGEQAITAWNKSVNVAVAKVINECLKEFADEALIEVKQGVRDKIEDKVLNEVKKKIWKRTEFAVLNEIKNKIWDRDELLYKTRNKIGGEVYGVDKKNKTEVINNFCCGSNAAYWLGFYDFFKEELKIKELEKLEPLIEISKNCNWWLPYGDVVFCSKKPTQITFNQQRRLHNDKTAAIKYKDGFSVYSLNGVSVTKEIVETPAEKLNCKLILTEKNAEVRQEIVRKIGYKRILKELDAKQIEKIDGISLYKNNPISNYVQQGDTLFYPEKITDISFDEVDNKFKRRLVNIDYELLELNGKGLHDREGNKPKFLKMTNASIPKEGHIEGAPKECLTVFDAIKFRNSRNSLPCFLS